MSTRAWYTDTPSIFESGRAKYTYSNKHGFNTHGVVFDELHTQPNRKLFDVMTKGVYSFLLWTQLYNVWFAFFNLIPIPPLDGSKILGELLPPRTAYQYENMVGQYGFYILLALVFTGIVGMIIRPLASTYMSLVNSILGIVF